MVRLPSMDEGRKRVLAIVAGILVARHSEDDRRWCPSVGRKEKPSLALPIDISPFVRLNCFA
jgi:hypothetical protein